MQQAGLRDFFRALEGDSLKAVSKINNVLRAETAARLNILPKSTVLGPNGPQNVINKGYISSLTATLDEYNDVIKTVAKTSIKLSDGTTLDIATNERYSGSIKELIGNLTKLSAAQDAYNTRRTRATENLTRAQTNLNTVIANETAAVTGPLRAAAERRYLAIARRDQITTDLRARRAIRPTLTGAAATSADRVTARLLTERANLVRQIAREQRLVNRLTNDYNNILANSPAIAASRARLATIQNIGNTLQRDSLREIVNARGEVISSLQKSPQIPTNIQAALGQSSELKRVLEKAGLGQPILGAPGGTYAENLYAQGAQFDEVTRDLVRGVTRVRGTFRDVNGVQQEFGAEIDKNGKLITRFGGQLSGAGQFLRQISRDFQKVIEWTVATTVVFGTLRYATQQLDTIKELDKQLTRFAVTAQLSPAQARQSFGELAKIAEQTATPLAEIVGAADDIALATQKAGQSTQDWIQDIYTLTNAVGIFTNLTGTDTVRATDLLTSTMKQLGINTSEIIPLLSKITAVAGGQSKAISDITQGLAVMAEASKQAGLSIDETIAAFQTLSLVTTKSPAEIATAFKNLTGSLDSPGGTKALAKFNIALREQDGTLRNILDVYREISQKIRQGIIPEGEIKGLIKGIAGGPRRVPDAAALLSVIDQIDLAVEKSKQASNEAVIANAKALDTTAAKLTQVQVLIDKITFERFGTEFKEFASTILDITKNILSLFNNGLAPTLIVLGAQFLAFGLAIRLGGKGLSFFGNLITETIYGLRSLTKVAGAAGTAVASTSGLILPPGVGGAAASGGLLARIGARGFGSLLRQNIGGLATGIVGGAAISGALSGGSPQSIIGGGLSGLGFGLLALPEPTLVSKIAGIVALLGGFAFSMSEQSGKTAEQSEEDAARIIDAYSKLKEAAISIYGSADVGGLKSTQAGLSKQITDLLKKENKTGDELRSLQEYQAQYIKNTIAMADATKQFQDALQELKDSGAFEGQEQALLAAQQGNLDNKTIQEIIRKNQLTLLQKVNPNAQLPESLSALSNVNAPLAEYRGSTGFTLQQFKKGDREIQTVTGDLRELLTEGQNVTKLFNATGTILEATFAPTGENIDLINGAIKELSKNNESLAASLQKTFDAWIINNNAIAAYTRQVELASAYAELLTAFDPEKAATIIKLIKLTQEAYQAELQNPSKRTRTGGPDDPITKSLNEQVFNALSNILGEAVNNPDFKFDRFSLLPLIEKMYEGLPIVEKSLFSFEQYSAQILLKLGFDLESLGLKAEDGFSAVSQAAQDSAEALDEYLPSFREKLAGLSASLEGEKDSLDSSTYKDRRKAINLLIKSTDDLFKVIGDGLQFTPQFDAFLQSWAEDLSSIPGLEDAATLSASDFIERLLEMATQGEFTSGQIQDLVNTLLHLGDTLALIDRIKKQFDIRVNVLGLEQLKAVLKGMYELSRRQEINKYGESWETAGDSSILAAIKEIEDAQKNFSTPSFNYGGGSSGGGKNGPDVSLLDLPEEIADAVNQSELLKEAIKRAKELQSQVPGADKEAADDIVELLNGTKRILEVRGVADDYLRRALEELADVERKRLELESKADTIRGVRIGAGDFSAIANVPVNSRTGVSAGGTEGPFNITLNLNGTVLTPAQFQQFADLIAASIWRQANR